MVPPAPHDLIAAAMAGVSSPEVDPDAGVQTARGASTESALFGMLEGSACMVTTRSEVTKRRGRIIGPARRLR